MLQFQRIYSKLGKFSNVSQCKRVYSKLVEVSSESQRRRIYRELVEFSSDPEKQKLAQHISESFLPQIYDEMCYDSYKLDETPNEKQTRRFHCNKLRKILTDAMVGIQPSEVDVHYHINELGELEGYPFLDISEQQQYTYNNLSKYAKKVKDGS